MFTGFNLLITKDLYFDDFLIKIALKIYLTDYQSDK